MIVSVDMPSVREGNGVTGVAPSQLVFTLSLSRASSETVSVIVQSASASTAPATAKSDYVPLGKTRVLFSPGQTRQTVAISILGDTIYEEDERVALLLGSPIGAILKATSSEGTIVNDDAIPTLSINDISMAEGDRNYSRAFFTITLSNPSARTISVGYSTYSSGRRAAIGGTASDPNADYIAIPASSMTILTFAPGQLTKVIPIYVRGDTQIEEDETFFVRLSAPVNARLAQSIGTGTIQNDDQSPPAVPRGPTGSSSGSS